MNAGRKQGRKTRKKKDRKEIRKAWRKEIKKGCTGVEMKERRKDGTQRGWHRGKKEGFLL